MNWNFGFSGLSGRFQDTVNSIFRKVQNRKDSISARAEALFKQAAAHVGKETGNEDIKITLASSDFPDPLTPFKNAFSQLLAPKQLLDPNIKNQKLSFRDGTETREITALSSGEREVVNIVFDFLLRKPQDCIVVFDEPELHLHPELSYKLLQTLKTSGVRNQFIFCTHSPDIITASLDDSVVFISPPKTGNENQAVVVREDDHTHQALKLIGQSIGIVSLGRRVVLVEGEHGSLDKQTYGAILRGRFPNLVLAPSGGKSQVQSFGATAEHGVMRGSW
jgi:predicted ATPase